MLLHSPVISCNPGNTQTHTLPLGLHAHLCPKCSVVVFDEIHEVAGGRGHTYRSLLSKLRWASSPVKQKLAGCRVASASDRLACYACLCGCCWANPSAAAHAANASCCCPNRYMQATAQRKVNQQGNQQGSPSPGNGSQANGSEASGSQADGNSAGDDSQAAAAYQPMRIVCMSATRTGQSATARLLGARVYVKSTEREVQLQCHLVRHGRGEGLGRDAGMSALQFLRLLMFGVHHGRGRHFPVSLHTLFLCCG